jgi:hypothetical protein
LRANDPGGSGGHRIPWSSPTGTETGGEDDDDGLEIAQDGSVGSVDGKLFDFVGFMGLGKG